MPLFTPRTNPKSFFRQCIRLRLSREALTASVVLPASAECHQPPRHQNQSPLRNGCHAFDHVIAPTRNPIRYTLGGIHLIPYPTCFCPLSGHQKGPLTSSLCNGFNIFSLRRNYPFLTCFRNDALLVRASTPLTVSRLVSFRPPSVIRPLPTPLWFQTNVRLVATSYAVACQSVDVVRRYTAPPRAM